MADPLTITVELPFPPSELRPNAHKHGGTNRIAREYGDDVWLCLREQLGPPPKQGPTFRRARLDMTAIYPDGRWHWDNDAVVAAFKRARDNFKVYGLIWDDHPQYLVLGSVETEIDRNRASKRLRVTLTELTTGNGDEQ